MINNPQIGKTVFFTVKDKLVSSSKIECIHYRIVDDHIAVIDKIKLKEYGNFRREDLFESLLEMGFILSLGG